MDHHFINEDLARSLSSETELSKIISHSAFAFLISALGILVIAGFVCELKLKEVNLRKVLGATDKHIYRVISTGFYKSLLISFTIAVPLSVVLVNNWLNAYSDRASVEPISILLIGLLNLILISTIVVANSIKTMLVNPCKLLRDE